jgi:hypothetical protein
MWSYVFIAKDFSPHFIITMEKEKKEQIEENKRQSYLRKSDVNYNPKKEKIKKLKPIKINRNSYGDFWNPNDGTKTYSRNIVNLLDYLNIHYELKDETKI